MARLLALLAASLLTTPHAGSALADPGPARWSGDLTPISADDWTRERAAHLHERAGFGGTPQALEALAKLPPEQAVRRLG